MLRHCGKVHRRHRYPGTICEQPSELLQREEFEKGYFSVGAK